MLKMEEAYTMNTNGEFYYSNDNYIKIDNTNLSAKEVAEKIKKEFEL
jgi:hypothetical protein